MDIDFTKVKKSPVAKDSAAVNYYRGGGVRIHVYATEIAVHVDGTDTVITRQGDYTDTPTGEVKKLAAAMLNKAEQDSKPWTKAGHTHPVKDERTDNWGTTRENVSVKVPTLRLDRSKAQPAFMNPAHKATHVVRSPLAAMFSTRSALA